MVRKLMLALASLAVLGFAVAQVTVDPVEVGVDQIAKGASEASVDQTVELILPKATALHLAANTITFDLEYLDGTEWEARARGDADATPLSGGPPCVYVAGADSANDLGSSFWNQTQVIPGLVAYETVAWDQIKLIYTNSSGVKVRDATNDDRVVTYPPIRIGENGLVDGSKDYFVCYQTFVIQLFSNFGYFDLQVSRNDDTAQGIEHLYVQGNACYNFGQATGLYDLPDDQSRHLLPRNMNFGPTGTHSGDCNPNSSWMDVLGVLAVKVNADHYGTSTANLTYTLMSSDSQF